VKRFSADDSAGSRVKVGHRQAFIARKTPRPKVWGFFVGRLLFESDSSVASEGRGT
jgi:hypothetical protein